MGISDAMPGVSGGTMALVLGIYARLVDAVSGVGSRLIRRTVSRDFWRRVMTGLRTPATLQGDEEGADAGRVLLLASVAAGVIPALAGGGLVLPSLLSLYPAQMKALFLGLVLASVTLPARQIGRWRPGLVVLAVITAAATAWFAGLPERTSANARGRAVLHFAEPLAAPTVLTPRNVVLSATTTDGLGVEYGLASTVELPAGTASADIELVARMAGAAGNAPPGSVQSVRQSPAAVAAVSQPTPIGGGRDPSLAFVFVAGVIAISAMTLPGVSGAFVLLLLGVYHYVTHALKATLAGGHPDSALVVATMIAAMVAGLLTFARVLRWLFSHWREGTLAVLVGLMTGSLRKLWPFVEHAPNGREIPTWPAAWNPEAAGVVVLFAAGAAAVLVLEFAARARCPRQDSNLGPTA